MESPAAMRFYFFRRDNRHTGTKNFDADFAEGARRCNPVISLFAQRLEAQGKAFKVVIIPVGIFNCALNNS